jgi:molybdate transport system ATP-binding protein
VTTEVTPQADLAGLLAVDLHGRVGDLPIEMSLRTSDRPTVLVGPNGAGKTSTLRLILGALVPRRGRVALGTTILFDHARRIDVPIEERRIALVPQRPALFPHLDVLANVAYGAPGQGRRARTHLARAVLADLGIEGLARRRPGQLSGGEAQRVALARALASSPRALLLDEPLAALDAGLRRDVRRFLVTALRRLAIPTILVTHDRTDAEVFGGEVIVIERGCAVQRGTLSALAAHPGSAFVRHFVEPRFSPEP